MRALWIAIIILITGLGLVFYTHISAAAMVKGDDLMDEKPEGYPVAYFAGGCFWCMESEFRALDGVLYTRVGYMGGNIDDPSYRDVTTGKTGHAEAVEVTFDPSKTSYKSLVEYFLTKAHDPTQVDRQGVDVGTQYRSAIFYVDEAQQKTAKDMIDSVTMNKVYNKPIATQILPVQKFWEGEEYHQQYYEKYEAENGTPHIRVLLKKKKK